MSPLSRSKVVTLIETLDDGTKIYSATVDPEWTVVNVPFGGFALALILNAAMQFQKNAPNVDPIYVTCFFLKALTVSSQKTELHVKPIRPESGKAGRFTNLQVDLYQDGILKAYAHLIFSNIALEKGPNLPETYRPICPLSLHPANVLQLDPTFGPFNFRKHYDSAVDPSVYPEKHDAVFGCWTEFADKSGAEKLEADTMGLFLDVLGSPFAATGEGLEGDYKAKMWRPTIVMNIEFKVRFPFHQNDGVSFSPMTLGSFSRKPHLRNGRYSDVVELWTAPCRIGQKDHVIDEAWREKMVCVAVGSQTALLVPASMNERHRVPVMASRL